jgi:hypothetical protein
LPPSKTKPFILMLLLTDMIHKRLLLFSQGAITKLCLVLMVPLHRLYSFFLFYFLIRNT